MIKDILRPKFQGGLSHECIAHSLGVSKGAVAKYLSLAGGAGLDWASKVEVDEASLERQLMGGGAALRRAVEPEYARVHIELRYKGVTLMLARLRHTMLADVHAADAALAAFLPSLNERRFQKLDGGRASLFASLDAPNLSALPAQRWQWATFKTVAVHIDDHVEVEGHRYSVSHSLVGFKLEARITDALVEVMHRGERVACHARSSRRDGFTDAG